MRKWLTFTLFMLSSSVCMPLFADYTVNITDPSDQQTFQNDAESIAVSVSVTPLLQKADMMVILIDGQQYEDPEHTSQFSLPALERGSHTLQARVITNHGNITDSEPITIFQQRHSALLGPGGGPKTPVNQMTVRQ
jgi:hypothetical protein